LKAESDLTRKLATAIGKPEQTVRAWEHGQTTRIAISDLDLCASGRQRVDMRNGTQAMLIGMMAPIAARQGK
jgi:hypothetical protein